MKAKLRVCASCEWIFKGHKSCPKCGFAHYGARFVYGNKCYRYEETQQPWLDKKVAIYKMKLLDGITVSQQAERLRLNGLPSKGLSFE